MFKLTNNSTLLTFISTLLLRLSIKMADDEAFYSGSRSMVDEEGEGVRNFFSHHELEEILIEEVKTFRCIWDTKCRGFKDSGGVVRAAWKAISQKLGKDGMSISLLD